MDKLMKIAALIVSAAAKSYDAWSQAIHTAEVGQLAADFLAEGARAIIASPLPAAVREVLEVEKRTSQRAETTAEAFAQQMDVHAITFRELKAAFSPKRGMLDVLREQAEVTKPAPVAESTQDTSTDLPADSSDKSGGMACASRNYGLPMKM